MEMESKLRGLFFLFEIMASHAFAPPSGLLHAFGLSKKRT